MIELPWCLERFGHVKLVCGPESRMRAALRRRPMPEGKLYGIAVGKAARAMARAVPVLRRGVCVSNFVDDDPLPEKWAFYRAAHPVPDESSLLAADAVIDLVASAGPEDQIIALISGGASAMIERPIGSLEQFRADIARIMASGADIHTINRARIERSQIKGGKLAQMAVAPIHTFIASDVIGDDPAIIGSGPTIPARPQDRVTIVTKMRTALTALHEAVSQVLDLVVEEVFPIAGDVGDVARELTAIASRANRPLVLAGGEPTVQLPADHGEGGRAQQLALHLARALAGSGTAAFVIGSDGIDGPPLRGSQSPAGAFVDGRTWKQMITLGLEPDRALERCDATRVLDAVGALVITGPTGINHGDLVMIG